MIGTEVQVDTNIAFQAGADVVQRLVPGPPLDPVGIILNFQVGVKHFEFSDAE